MKTLKTGLSAVIGAAIAVCGGVAHATIVVNTMTDDSSTGNCSLREAIQAVNTQSAVDACPAGSPGDTIQLPPGTITVNSALTILSSVTLQGSGYERTTINFGGLSGNGIVVGNGTGRPSASLLFLTLFQSQGTLFRIRSNASGFVEYCQFLNGTSTSAAGGMVVEAGASANVLHSIIANNGGFSGAGVANQGNLTMQYVTLSGNHGEHGSALHSSGTTSVADSTIANNSAALEGSAVYVSAGIVNLDRVTIAYNTSNTSNVCTQLDSRCGAVYRFGGTVNVKGSVIAHNSSAGQIYNIDCAAVDPAPSTSAPYATGITSLGFNMLGTSSGNGCPLSVNDISPQNARFTSTTPAWYGGVGSALMPAANSTLLNRISSSNAYCSGSWDQRLLKRGRTSACDIGAVERSNAAFVVGDPASYPLGDNTVKVALESLGFTVTMVDDNQATSAMVSGNHIVVVSESVTSTLINTNLRDISAGVLMMEPSLYDDMRMTGTASTQFGNATNQAVVSVYGTAVGQTLGQVGYDFVNAGPYTGAQTVGWGIPGAGAFKHIRVTSSNTHWAMFDYFRGATLASGNTTANGHRVGFFTFPDTANALTTGGHQSGLGLLYQAILLAGIE